MTDDAFNRFVFDDAPRPGYVQMPPLTLDEINEVLTRAAESRPRLAVAPGRFDEICEHVRSAGLWVEVVASPLLDDDQAVLMPSEAEMRDHAEKLMRDGFAADLRTETAALMAELEVEAASRGLVGDEG